MEATAQQVIEWSDGSPCRYRCPFRNHQLQRCGLRNRPLNNALIYPGLGLGMLASEAKLLTDEMIGAAAHSLSGIVNPGQPGAPVLPTIPM